MSDHALAIIVALLGGGGIVALINALIARRKVPSEIKNIDADAEKKEAETTEIIMRAAGKAAEMLETQLCKLSAENNAMRSEIELLRKDNTILRGVQEKHEKEISELQAMCERFDEVLTGAHMLYEQVVELKVEPKYKPPERRKKT